MSIYSIVGLIIFSVIVLTGLILKLILRRKRNDLEGFHGYTINKENVISSGDDNDGFRTI